MHTDDAQFQIFGTVHVPRTYAMKNAELTVSKSRPVGSPPSASCGSPISLALPRFVLSRSAYDQYKASRYWLEIHPHAKRYRRHRIGRIRPSSFRTSFRSCSSAVYSLIELALASETSLSAGCMSFRVLCDSEVELDMSP